MSANATPLTTSDGTPLKKKLGQALFKSRLRAFGLVTPLLLLIFFAFALPIVIFLKQAFYNPTFTEHMVNVTPLLQEWDAKSEPTEEMYAALVAGFGSNQKR